MKILVTGSAGFIGSSLVDTLLLQGYEVVGIDNFNDYYDPQIKEANIYDALKNKKFRLYRKDILDETEISNIFRRERPSVVVHLAARAGVRPSIENPALYCKTNVLGTVNLLNVSRLYKCNKFIFGSSSSVYGESIYIPFREDDLCNNIVSPYGSSKRAAEFFIESFNKTYGLHAIILRFFTVYGERGRPDMAPAIFTKAVINQTTLEIFGDKEAERDYTYIGDVIDGIIKSIKNDLDFEIINLGNSNPVKLKNLIGHIENQTGKTAKIKIVERQGGDVVKTWANTEKAAMLLGWKPKVDIGHGIEKYIKWLINRS